MGERPKGFFSIIRCHTVHGAFKGQCVFIVLQGLVGQEVEGLAFPYAAVTFFPVLYAGHVAHDIEYPYQ